jgi:hypothetical protein
MLSFIKKFNKTSNTKKTTSTIINRNHKCLTPYKIPSQHASQNKSSKPIYSKLTSLHNWKCQTPPCSPKLKLLKTINMSSINKSWKWSLKISKQCSKTMNNNFFGKNFRIKNKKKKK